MLSTYQSELQAWKELASWKWWSCLACFLGILYEAGVSPDHHHSCQQPPAPFWLRLLSFPSSEPLSEPRSWPWGSETYTKTSLSKRHHNDKMNSNTHTSYPVCSTLFLMKVYTVAHVACTEDFRSHLCFYISNMHLKKTHKRDCNLKAHLMMQIISDWMLRLSRYEEVSWNHTSAYKRERGKINK